MRTCTCRLPVVALAVLLGTAFAARADEAADRAALDLAKQAWVGAFNARNADAMAEIVTEDIVMLAPNAPPVKGREAVRAVWRQAVSSSKVHATVTTDETVILGQFAWRMGAYTHTLPTGTVVSRGKCLEIWKRVDGQWKMYRYMFSGNEVAPRPKFAPVPRPSEPVLDSPGVK
jgi:ketosteroid isomerase-like protein